MKRIILPVVLCCLVSLSFGQSMKKASKYFDDKNFDKAKTEVEGILEKNPNDAEALYLKSKIYSKIADSAALHNLVNGDARAEAFSAFQKAVADSANMKAKLAIMKDNYQPIFDMYTGYYQDAVDDFNKAAQSGSQEDFTKAMHAFIKADEVGHYIAENEWAKIGMVDTTLVLNIGKAAINAKDNDIALKYFTKLADAKIAGPVGTDDEGFKLPYQWLELHYKDAGDEANMLKYAQLGNEVFPKESYFNFVLMDYYRAKKDMPKVLGLYEHIIAENPDSIKYHFSYANDIFGYIYNSDDDVKVENKDQWMKTLKTELDKAMALDPNDINTNWLTSQYYYNLGIESRDSASKAKDAAAKTELNNKAMDYWKQAIPYAQKAIDELGNSGDPANKSKYKSVVNLMQNIYQSMGDKDNLKKYQDMYDNADQKFSK